MVQTAQILIDKLAAQASTRLAVGEDAVSRLVKFEHVSVTNDFEHLQTNHSEHFDFVLVSGVFNTMLEDDRNQLVAVLRDQLARELVILLEEETIWPSTDLISLGLRQLPFDTGECRGFYFALESYKRVPDWLNTRFWANPENFNKYRW